MRYTLPIGLMPEQYLSQKGTFDLDDYIDYIIDMLRKLGPKTHVLAVCQPSVPVLAAVSILEVKEDPCSPNTMTLMGGPIDTRKKSDCSK